MKILLNMGLVVVFLLLSALFLGNNALAQSCLGSQTCCPAGALQWDCPIPSCQDPDVPSCGCTQTCNDITQACSLSGGMCRTSWNASDCAYIIGSCTYIPPSTPTPPGATPTPPGGGGGCTSGDCFTGISNCGDVGRVNGSGSCSGGLCCALPGGPPPVQSCSIASFSVVAPADDTLDIGEIVTVSAPTGGSGFFQYAQFRSANPAVAAIVGSGRDNNRNDGYTAQVRGDSVGSAQLIVDVYMTGPSGGAELTCTRSMTVWVNTVSPPTTTVNLTASPASGPAPLNGVALTATVSGNAPGAINYQFDCNSDGTPELTQTSNSTTVSTGPLCNYATNGTYTATVTVDQGGAPVQDTTQIQCGGGPTLSLNVNANPSSGAAPLNGVDVITQLAGTATGNINWTIDCQNDGTPEITQQRNSTNYTWVNACNYPTAGTYTISVTATRQGVTATDTKIVTVGGGAGQCTIPRPVDPPSIVCAPDASSNGSITWRWDAVTGASEYSFVVEDSGGNPVAGTATGWLPANSFGPACAGGGECRRTTSLAVGSYRSAIQARGLCTVSAVGRSSYQNIGVCPSGPWWQVTGGEVVSNGNLQSLIPLSCTADPICEENLILNDPISNRPAAAVYDGNYDFSNDPLSRGSVSASDEWLARTPTRPNLYTYAFFNNLASGKTFRDFPGGTSITTNEIASTQDNTAGNGGYAWMRVNGNATLGAPGGAPSINVNKKAILFINGNLTIYDRVLITDLEDDFLMVIVSGNIDIDPALTSPTTATPTIQGIYTCNGQFSTGTNGTDDGILVVEGSVAAGTFDLERDLVAENINTPAEHFIYSPELITNYPSALSERHLVWREVAP